LGRVIRKSLFIIFFFVCCSSPTIRREDSGILPKIPSTEQVEKKESGKNLLFPLPPDYESLSKKDELSRAEVAAILIRELKPEEIPGFAGREPIAGEIPDIENHWAKAFVEKAINFDLMKVYPDGTFRPDDTVTRAHYALLLHKILTRTNLGKKLEMPTSIELSPFPDVPNSHYTFKSIMICVNLGLMKSKLDGTFGLNDSLSGAEAIEAARILREQLKYRGRVN